MTRERTIGRLRSKLRIYRISYDRAVANKDFDSAAGWRDGYNKIVREIHTLRENQEN